MCNVCNKKVVLRSPFSAADWERHVQQVSHQRLVNRDTKSISNFFTVHEGMI